MKPTDKTAFLEKYNISERDFDYCELNWKQLQKIYENFVSSIKSDHLLETAAQQAVLLLGDCSTIHSIRYRIKNPEHLIAKIVREKIINLKNADVTIQNYRTEIEDIVGIRLLHVFKDDWIKIHDFLKSKRHLSGAPYACYRKGDEEKFIDQLKRCEVELREDDDGYRSIHYSTEVKAIKNTYACEIQVRTLFEEAWSEIGHAIRYPNNLNSPFLKNYFKIYNRFSGALDEMGTFIRNAEEIEHLNEKNVNKRTKAINDIENKLTKLTKDDKEIQSLKESIGSLRVLNQGKSEKPKEHLKDRKSYYKKAIKCLQKSNGIYRTVTEGPFFLHPKWVVDLRNAKHCPPMPNYDVEINKFLKEHTSNEKADIRFILRNSSRYITKLEELIPVAQRKIFKDDMLENINDLFVKDNSKEVVKILCQRTGFISISEIYPDCVLASNKSKENEPLKEGWLYDSQEFVSLKTREFDKIFLRNHNDNKAEVNKLITFIKSLWTK